MYAYTHVVYPPLSSSIQLGRVLIMPVYPPSGGVIGLSPSSSFASDSLDFTTPKPIAPVGSFGERQQIRGDTGSDRTPSSRGSGVGSGGVKFLLALNAPSTVPWGLIRAKVRHTTRRFTRVNAGFSLKLTIRLVTFLLSVKS